MGRTFVQGEYLSIMTAKEGRLIKSAGRRRRHRTVAVSAEDNYNEGEKDMMTHLEFDDFGAYEEILEEADSQMIEIFDLTEFHVL